jgi:CrcB protein
MAVRVAGSGFPWGTLAVNWLGCLVIGVLWAAGERAPIPAEWSSFLFIGVLGAFTTFSTFGIETLNLLQNGQVMLGVANIVASTLGGVFLALLGLFLGRMLAG